MIKKYGHNVIKENFYKSQNTIYRFFYTTKVALNISEIHNLDFESFVKKRDLLFEKSFDMCKKFNKIFSRTEKNSDLWRINHNNCNTTKVSSEIFECLQIALKYSRLSNGAVDPSIGAVVELWDFSKDSKKSIPNSSKINEALSHVDYKKIKLFSKFDGGQKNYYVQLLDPKMILDLGWIAKGYIADKIIELWKANGVKEGFVNLGGNFVKISNGDSTNDKTGIIKPFSKNMEIMFKVNCFNKSVVTSGNYERYFKTNDKIYHHILDVKNGFPTENDLMSVTIISDKSVDGDALSTACFCMGMEKAINFLQNFKNIDAYFITKNWQIYCKNGVKYEYNKTQDKNKRRVTMTDNEKEQLKKDIKNVNDRLSKLTKEEAEEMFGGESTVRGFSGATPIALTNEQ